MARKREERQAKHAYRNQEKQSKKVTGGEEDKNFVTFNNQMATMGLTLREVPGDGNCLFRALGDQLEGHTRNHLQHRQETAEFMKQHRLDFEPFVEDDVPFDRHVGNLEKVGTYAGNDAIVAFARNQGLTVVIHQLNSPLWKVHGTETSPGRELHIAYHNGDHYNSIRRIGDNSENPANVQIGAEHNGSSELGKSSQGLPDCFVPYYKEEEDADDNVLENDDINLVDFVMKRTGCTDRFMVQQTLEDCLYDVEMAVEFLIAMAIACPSSNDDDADDSRQTKDDELWGVNGTAARIFGNNGPERACPPNGHCSEEGGAKQKLPRHVLLQQKMEQKKVLTNKQRKEQKRNERKQNCEIRKKQKSVSFDVTADLHEVNSVMTQLGCLNI